ncbi:MAG: gliding motility-associated C-terminal domain-containing protein [Taibaiella sp.]|jgi:gliding motility-associated-like protein
MKKILLFAVIVGLCPGLSAQTTVCNGIIGPPILNFTFGQGNQSQSWYFPLSTYAPGLTTNTILQTSGSLPGANTSGLVKNSSVFGPAPNWLNSNDHTGNPNGLFMGINMPDQIGDTVVEYVMTGLCPNTTLQYSIWLINLMAPTHPMVVAGSSFIEYPNFTMKILDPSNNVIAQQITGNVATDGSWHQYTVLFSNGSNTTVKLQLINNTSGSGYGNDVALDDITISPCVPDALIQPLLDTTLCQSTNINFTGNITPGVYTNPNYQWQYSTDAGSSWNNSGSLSPTNTQLFTFNTVVAPAEYWIRYRVSPQGITQNANCHAESNISIVRIDTIDQDFLAFTDTTVCPTTVFELNINSIYASSYLWNTGANTSSILVNGEGSYSAEISSLYGCKAYDTTIVYFTNEQNLGPDTTFCEGASYTLQSSNNNADSYLWSTGAQTPSLTVTESGLYWVSVDLDGCKVTDTVMVTFNEKPVVNLGPDSAICELTTTNLASEVFYPGAAYLWNNGNNNPALNNIDAGKYWLQITTYPDCTSADTIAITSKECDCITLVPNAFSPNGDGINDKFLVRLSEGCSVAKFELSIYNRYGERVFLTADPTKGWDGTFKGKKVDSGTFMYYTRITLRENPEIKFYKGDITLIR